MTSFSVLTLTSTLLFVAVVSAGDQKHGLVNPQPLVLKYHNGRLLNGSTTLNLMWYGRFSAAQRAVVSDFLLSISSSPPPPSVASWWGTTAGYKHGPFSLTFGRQIFDPNLSLGKSLKASDLRSLARKAGTGRRGSAAVVLTSADVAVEGFCSGRCGTHSSLGRAGARTGPFIWVGDSTSQCPGHCAWPFHQPIYGPQTPPLTAPNGDVGIDGMVINLAAMLAGAVTNPYGDGYYQGAATAPLEAVTACTGIFGSGAYPGYPGKVLVDPTNGASYNARGLGGREYLLPAMWDPKTSKCATLV